MKPEKENIEEVAKRLFNQVYGGIISISSFKKGAKWQQERSYSEEEVIQLIDNFRNSNETDLTKWFDLNKK